MSSLWFTLVCTMRITLVQKHAAVKHIEAINIKSNANLNDRKRGYTHSTIDALRSIRARAARTICGAYKATLGAALNMKSFLLLVEQQIWRH